MKTFIIKELLKPTLRRVGSMIAGGLMTLGVAQEAAQAIEVGAVAAILVVCDLFLSWHERKKSG